MECARACVLVPLKWRWPSTEVDVILKSGPGKDDWRRIKRKIVRLGGSR